ncbi:MAG TPA: SLATT domain-containing protein [Ignavibacteria bacterium]|nr:SLATT domain-containing protein [Ignavibacteria bacterium]
MTNKEKITYEAKRIEEDSLYSAKGHFYTGQRWVKVNLWLGSISVIFSAIAGASALSQFDYHNIIAGSLAIIVAGLTAIVTFLNPNERASVHLKAGNKYSALKNDTRIFYNIEMNEIGDKETFDSLQKLNAQRNKLNIETHQIPKWAFKKARKGIEEGESKYKVD